MTGNDSKNLYDTVDSSVSKPMELHEATEKYVQQKYANDSQRRLGPYTIRDYNTWPEEERVELIDGIIIKMDAPGFNHQYISSKIYNQIQSYIDARGGECLPLYAPLSVQLDEDEYTMVQPDLIILCDRNRIRRYGIFGAPDFLLEIVSPSNPQHDYVLKLKKYRNAGVREYWIVDPQKNVVTVFIYDENYLPHVYPMEEEIPVSIYQNDLKIQFDSIRDFIREIH